MTRADEIRDLFAFNRWANRHLLDAAAALDDDVLARLDDEALEREVDYRNTAGTPFTSRMDEMLRHVVDHSTYQRGQVVTMLRQLGATPPPTGLIVFYRERRRRA